MFSCLVSLFLPQFKTFYLFIYFFSGLKSIWNRLCGTCFICSNRFLFYDTRNVLYRCLSRMIVEYNINEKRIYNIHVYSSDVFRMRMTGFESFQLMKLDVHYKYITLWRSLFHCLKVRRVNSKCPVNKSKQKLSA